MMVTDNTTWEAMLLFAAVAAAGVDCSKVSPSATSFSYKSPPPHIKRRDAAFVVPTYRSLPLPTRLYVSAKDDDITSYSEEDIIRILRTTPRYHNNNNGEACHTVLDVLHLISRHSHSISISNDSLELSSINAEQIINDISPNIAAAALRRLTSSPFLPISYQTNKYRRQRQKRNYKKVSKQELDLYDKLIHLLLNKVSYSIEDQLGFLRSAGSNNDNVNSKSPRLLSRKDTFIIPPSTNSVLNWYALADSLCSISNLASVLLGNNRHDDIIKGHLLTNISPTEQDSILNLFDSIIQYLSWDNRVTSSFVRCIGPRRLTRDVLQPIVIIETAQRNKFHDTEDIIPVTAPYTQLIGVLSSYLVLPHTLEKLSVSDISTTLWHMTKIYSPYGQYPTKLKTPQRILLRTFMKRVRKFNVRSGAEGSDLVQIIWSVSRLMRYLIKQDDTVQPNTSMIEQTVLPLSIRLPGEDESDLLPLSKKRTDKRVTNIQSKDQSSIPTNILKEEAVTMFHTLVNEIVLPPFYSRNKNDNSNTNNYQGAVEKVKLESLSLRQNCDVLEAATSLDISQEDIIVPITKILQYLVTSPSSPLSRCRSCSDISRLLLSLQRLRVGSGIYNDVDNRSDSNIEESKSSNDIDSTDEVELESQCVQLIGERFLEIILWRKKKFMLACSPKTLAVTLRSGVLMFQGNLLATRAMLNAARTLIVDEAINEEDDQDTTTFLDECNEFEISNYLFAFAMAKQFDEDVFTALTDRMIEEDIISSCSPSSASRALWSCAMLVSLNNVDVKSKMQQNESSSGELFLHERLINLFHQLSPLLLSEASLSPTDISMAMWAMAKGIFDELAQLMTMKLDHSNTRLVSQALWSCGKMIEFESQAATDANSDDEDEDIESEVKPPYVEYVEQYIHYLVVNRDQMTPKHLTQSIWAMGRLRLSNYYLIDEMANIAYQTSDSLNAREVANIVWGLMKGDYDDSEVISKLVQRVINSPILCKDCSAQDASTIMFVLGKLRIRDKMAFAVLSSVLKDKPGATTQSITNTLWAHEVLRIPPPPALLMSWASTRLNLDVPDMKEE